MSAELTLLLMAVPGLIVLFLLFYVFADLPHRRRQEMEARLKASAISHEGVWPPAPTTYAEPPETEAWAWCMQCHRASTMDTVSDNGGRCGYSECAAPVTELVAWRDLAARLPALPETPTPGVVYADLLPIQHTQR